MFFEQLTKACKKQGKTVTAVAKELKISKSNVTNWKNGTTPNGDVVVRLSELLGVTADYLLKDDAENNFIDISVDEKELLSYYKELDEISKSSILGKAEGLAEAARRRKAELEAAQKTKVKPKPKALPLPLPEPEPSDDIDNEAEDGFIYLDFPDLPVSAGTGVYLHDDYAEQIKVAADEDTIRANYALRVAGDSMEPRFYDGDIVLIETQPSVEIGEVGIFIYEGEAYIKQFGGDCLISLNPKYKDIKITDPNSLYCKGRVFSVLDPIKNRYN